MNELELLKVARVKIAKPENWTQGWYARDASGYSVAPADESACKFCALGAILACGDDDSFGSAFFENAAASLRKNLPVDFARACVMGFNDDPKRTHAEVIDLFDRTIASLEAAS